MISFVHMGSTSLPCCGEDYHKVQRISETYSIYLKWINRYRIPFHLAYCEDCNTNLRVSIDGYAFLVTVLDNNDV